VEQLDFDNLSITFPSQAVDGVRLSSSPAQNQTFHSWDSSSTFTFGASGTVQSWINVVPDIGPSDFNTAYMLFTSIPAQTSLVIDTFGYAHSHSGSCDVFLDLHDPMTDTWKQVWSFNLFASGGGG
jgi:hypothetical protein